MKTLREFINLHILCFMIERVKMEKNSRFFDNAEAIFNGMNTFLTTKTVVGEPIVVGDTTIILSGIFSVISFYMFLIK